MEKESDMCMYKLCSIHSCCAGELPTIGTIVCIVLDRKQWNSTKIPQSFQIRLIVPSLRYRLTLIVNAELSSVTYSLIRIFLI